MDYLLVGNGRADNLTAVAERADVIVQINECLHADALPSGRTRYIFLTNSGQDVSRLIDCLISRHGHPQFANACIVQARNPAFYTMKRWLMRARRHRHWRDYEIPQSWRRLHGLWPLQMVSCLATLRLERELLRLGMPRSFMPSTGMIAYDWLRRRLQPRDRLAVAGFNFQGWERHPWNIENRIVRPIA